MRTFMFAILLLSSILVQRTYNATLLEASIAKIKEIKPESLVDMATQPLSEANFQALAKAVGTVFSSLQMLGLNDANNRLLALEQSTSILSTGQITLSSKIAQLDKDLNSRIDVLQAVINPVLESHKTKIAALEASGTSLQIKVAKLDVDLRSALATSTAKVTSLSQTVSTFSNNMLTIKSGLDIAMRALGSQITALSKAVDKKFTDEAALRTQCCTKNSDEITALDKKLGLLVGGTDIPGLDSRLKLVETDTKNLKSTVTDDLVPGQKTQNGRLDNLENIVYKQNDAATGVLSHENRIKTLEDSVKNINLAIGQPSSDEDIQSKVTKIGEELDALKKKVDDPNLNDDLTDQLENINKKLNALSDIVDMAVSENDLVGKVSAIRMDIDELQ